MTPLRQAMITAMQMQGFSPRTHESYLAAVTDLARYTHRAPDTLDNRDVAAYVQYLVTERGLSPSSVRLYFNGIRFLYVEVLHWPASQLQVTLPQRSQKIPELLTLEEVGRILDACTHEHHRMMLALCYGCGLRLNELRHLRVRDIDGDQRRLRIERGKGDQDRLVNLSSTLVKQLRAYWRAYRPEHWLFPGRTPGQPISESTIQKAFQKAKRRAGISKRGCVHALRHAFTTHQLESGLPVHRLQRLLGHKSLSSTVRYVHWLPDPDEGEGEHDLVGRLPKQK